MLHLLCVCHGCVLLVWLVVQYWSFQDTIERETRMRRWPAARHPDTCSHHLKAPACGGSTSDSATPHFSLSLSDRWPMKRSSQGIAHHCHHSSYSSAVVSYRAPAHNTGGKSVSRLPLLVFTDNLHSSQPESRSRLGVTGDSNDRTWYNSSFPLSLIKQTFIFFVNLDRFFLLHPFSVALLAEGGLYIHTSTFSISTTHKLGVEICFCESLGDSNDNSFQLLHRYCILASCRAVLQKIFQCFYMSK